jgi:hypothetical protein
VTGMNLGYFFVGILKKWGDFLEFKLDPFEIL